MVEIFFISPHPRRKLHLEHEWNDPLAVYIREWISLHLELVQAQNPGKELIAMVIPYIGLSQWFIACLRAVGIKYNLLLPCLEMDGVWSEDNREIYRDVISNANHITYIEEVDYHEGSQKNYIKAFREIKKKVLESKEAVLFSIYNKNSPRVISFTYKAKLTGRVRVCDLELEVGDKRKWKRQIKLEKATQKRIRLQKRLSFTKEEMK